MGCCLTCAGWEPADLSGPWIPRLCLINATNCCGPDLVLCLPVPDLSPRKPYRVVLTQLTHCPPLLSAVPCRSTLRIGYCVPQLQSFHFYAAPHAADLCPFAVPSMQTMIAGPALPVELSSWGGTKRPADSDAASDAAKRGRGEAGRQCHLSWGCMFHRLHA